MAETLLGRDDASVVALPPFANGTVIDGKYRVDHVIAEGGSGVVVAATHLALRQSVAIKYLKPTARAIPAIIERFSREGRLAARIPSEHVVRIFDVGEHPDVGPYIVMEHLKGRELSAALREGGPLPIPRAVDYVLQTCDALAHAHVLQIVHRDIKPENLVLAERPHGPPLVKIIDFGISKEGAPPEGTRRETAERERFGTPLYMSPEQLRSSAAADERSDIWSLGVLLHELLTGALPFDGDALPQLCTSILHDPPTKLTATRPNAPVALEAILLKCLEKEPGRRFRHVAELAQELAPFGPPDAHERAERIKKVLRKAGRSIRPPTPVPGSLDTAALRGFLPASVAATGADAAPPEIAPSRTSSRTGLVVGAVVALAVVVALVFLLSARISTSARPPALSSASATIAVSPPAPESASPTAPPSAGAVSPLATATIAAPSSLRASLRPPVGPATPSRPAPAHTPLAPAPVGRAAFGERK